MDEKEIFSTSARTYEKEVVEIQLSPFTYNRQVATQQKDLKNALKFLDRCYFGEEMKDHDLIDIFNQDDYLKSPPRTIIQ